VEAYILSDGEFDTEQLRALSAVVKRVLLQKGFAVNEKKLAPGELQYCMGCFGCWVKTPGECVLRDSMGEINRAMINSDVAVYLVPVVFGQFSANMKSALDRWIPNLLPFFIIRADGSTTHPARYEQNPQIVMIGYGEGLTEADRRLFADITARHRNNGAVLFYAGDDSQTERELSALELKRLGATV
jgi:multimeric flavodoxin WrbA